jgi:hypothetical protein
VGTADLPAASPISVRPYVPCTCAPKNLRELSTRAPSLRQSPSPGLALGCHAVGQVLAGTSLGAPVPSAVLHAQRTRSVHSRPRHIVYQPSNPERWLAHDGHSVSCPGQYQPLPGYGGRATDATSTGNSSVENRSDDCDHGARNGAVLGQPLSSNREEVHYVARP